MKITKYEGKNGCADNVEITDSDGNSVRIDACCMTCGTKDVKMVALEFKEEEAER
jgi:hypothetical protein